MKITPKKLESLKPGKQTKYITIGDGLHLEVRKNGKKYWRMRYRFRGKPRLESLGVFPAVSLQEAKQERSRIHVYLADNIDPRNERVSNDNVTFKQIGDGWLDAESVEWSPKHAADIRSRVKRYAYPEFGQRIASEITPLWIKDWAETTRKSTSKRLTRNVLGDISNIFDYGIVTEACTNNPASAIKRYFKAGKTGNFKAVINIDELHQMIKTISESRMKDQAKVATYLHIMLFPRPSELRTARQDSFNMDRGIWTNKLLKCRDVQRYVEVPLPTQAQAMIAPRLDGRELLFKGRGNGTFATDYLLYQLQTVAGIKGTVMHGYRATAHSLIRTELGYGHRLDLLEQQLGHVVRTPNGTAYDRADFIDERREMLQKWADFLFEDHHFVGLT